MGLSNCNLPSTTCLTSRIPCGQSITTRKLQQVEEAEFFLYLLGFSQTRVRNYGEQARIKVSENEIENIVKNQKDIVSRVKGIGFTYISLDIQEYRSGSMDEIL